MAEIVLEAAGLIGRAYDRCCGLDFRSLLLFEVPIQGTLGLLSRLLGSIMGITHLRIGHGGVLSVL